MIEVIRGIDKIKFVKFKDNWAEVLTLLSLKQISTYSG